MTLDNIRAGRLTNLPYLVAGQTRSCQLQKIQEECFVGARGLANFFLVDQSLSSIGGHHYDYLRLIGDAASTSGFHPVVGTNFRLPADSDLERLGDVYRVFRDDTYSEHSLLAGLEEMTRGGHSFFEAYEKRQSSLAGALFRRRRYRKLIKRRSEHIRKFAEDCDRFFSKHYFEDGDHAFFCTMSELDFMGLCAYLSNHPRTLQVNWHVQFHFAMLAGRTPEYDRQQTRLRSICECFQTAVDLIPYHQMRLYTTTDELAAQYNRMEVASFQSLSYPVDPRLFEQEEKPAMRPLKMTCAGAVRREKGQKRYLLELIDGLQTELAEEKSISINVQCKNARWLGQRNKSGVNRVNHPLNEEDYFELIRNSDIGLLYYDSRRYFSRRAGILSEFLANGKPVIVPAGSWLSNQIAEAGFQHANDVIANAESSELIPMTETKWNADNVPLAGGIISCDSERIPFECSFETSTDASVATVEFNWHWPLEPGAFCRVELEFWSEADSSLGKSTFVVGHRSGQRLPVVMANMPRGARKTSARFSNAYQDASISLKDVSFHLVNPSGADAPLPTGAVGVIVPAADQLVDSVRELITHYEHYQATAAKFAEAWSRRHDPLRTLQCLIGDPIANYRAA